MIQAIETSYKGYRFRSRLEARWAVFLDALGMKWEYEKQGFDLGGVRYLPDFFLPELDAWLEVKGAKPTSSEMFKAEKLSELSGQCVYVFYGEFKLPSDNDYPWTSPAAYYVTSGGGDWPYSWCECRDCGKLGIEFDGRSDRLPCKEGYGAAVAREDQITFSEVTNRMPGISALVQFRDGCHRHGGNLDKGYNSDSPKLLAAYRAAMGARFEHGERP